MEYSELEEAKASLAKVDKEIEQLREYKPEFTGYLKHKIEIRRKLLRRISELKKDGD